MAEYIDKWSVVNKLIDLENEFQQYKPFHGFEHAMYRKVCEAEIAIGKTPAADVVEVVHGRWEDIGNDWFDLWRCSACGTEWSFPYDPTSTETRVNFCPDCGARMDGE